MNVVQSYRKKNFSYTNGVLRKVEGICLYVRKVHPLEEKRLIAEWNCKEAEECPHAVVQKDRITQLIPWDNKGWYEHHDAGSTCIQLLLFCYGRTPDEEAFWEVYENAVQVCALLCKIYNLSPKADIRAAIFAADCLNRHQTSLLLFCEETAARMDDVTFHAKEPFQVKVQVPSLRVRKGPSLSNLVVKRAVGSEIYTITDKKESWGRIQGTPYYISLIYTKRI